MQRIAVFMALIVVLAAATGVWGAGSETKQVGKATSTATKTQKNPEILLIKTDAQKPFKVQITDKSLWTNVEVRESEERLELIVHDTVAKEPASDCPGGRCKFDVVIKFHRDNPREFGVAMVMAQYIATCGATMEIVGKPGWKLSRTGDLRRITGWYKSVTFNPPSLAAKP
ncbi:MAG: hypothetical protein P8182_07140 [Deltaproteobacteria bacterium]